MGAFQPVTRDWFARRFEGPSPAQAEAWPHIMAGESTLISAPTGSGKTLAAFLCAIDRMVFQNVEDPPERRGVRILYISPVKALARDVERNLQEPLASICALAAERGEPHHMPRVAVRSGDTPQNERQKMRRDPPDILITTPESLFLILTSEAREILRAVDTVIVDEIHAIVGSKRGAHLALSVERLVRLAGRPVQRIGLSATSRPLDLVARFLAGSRGRPVKIVDASMKRAFDVRVESAVTDMTALPREALNTPRPDEGGLQVERPWIGSGTSASGRGIVIPDSSTQAPSVAQGAPSILPAIHARVLELILAHRSTIVFVNSRRTAERVASALNERAGESGPVCRAHHGSLAREERELVEGALKDGTLRAVVATSSLELGIDMGLVDLVVQIETPPSVASATQRVGRASHHLGGVPKALVFPTYRGDLLAAAATIHALQRGEIEPVTLPRNPLDVLAQQILSILVADPMFADDLFALVRSAASFATLPRKLFDGVLDMLAGRYPSHEFRDLRPRIVWNRETGELRARVGVRLILFANAGTIPDRGLFGVFLGGSSAAADAEGRRAPSRRVGELDEEMVFESRVGDIVMLGASSWRIDEIQRDRVMVMPAPGLRGRMPFWKADRPPRPVENARRIGALSRQILSLGRKRGAELLQGDYALDERAAANLTGYLFDQKSASAAPTDETLVLERMRDEMGDLRLCLLSSFGGRVHQPLALAIAGKAKRDGRQEVEMVVSDDGIILRLHDRERPLTLLDLLPASTEVEALVRAELSDSTLFAARFREAAGRSLLLPRRRPGSRSPLWAQRQKAHALLSVASRFPAFPLILEAYRECLTEDFDVAATVELMKQVEKREVKAVTLDVDRPSPFASALLFGYVSTVMYDDDAPLAERRAHALSIDESQLQALLGETAFQDLLDEAALVEVHEELQSISPGRRIRTADGLHEALVRLGDLSLEEVAARAAGPEVAGFAETLAREHRVVEVAIAGEQRLIAVEDAALCRDALNVSLPRGLPKVFLEKAAGGVAALVERFARTRGPFTTAAVRERFGLAPDTAQAHLEALETGGRLIRGPFTRQPDDVEWCDVDALRRIRRLSLARARGGVNPVEARDYARFLMAWHDLGPASREGAADAESMAESAARHQDRSDALLAAIEQLQGCPLPASALETDILAARVSEYRSQDLDLLVARGEVVLEGRGPLGARDGKVALYLAPNRFLFGAVANEPLAEDVAARVRAVLQSRGALFLPEIEAACPGLRRSDVVSALWSLFWNGEVTNDSIAALRARVFDPAKSPGKRFVAPRFGRYRSRLDTPADGVGRFSLLTPRPAEAVESRLALIEQWLARHGVLTREAIAAEGKEGGFGTVYPLLRALEERGQVRRGYFIEGLGVLQFADAAAVDRMREMKEAGLDGRAAVLAATDPANPFGVTVHWPSWCEGAAERRARAHVVIADGELTALLFADGARVMVSPAHATRTADESTRLARISAQAIAAWMRRRALRIIGHEAQGARETPAPALNRSALAPALREAGLAPSGPGFRL